MAEIKHFQGTLTLSDADKDMNKMNYGLVNLETSEFQSITDELERIYNSGTNMAHITIRKFNDNHVLDRMGSLHKGKDPDGIEGWYIGSFPLDFELDTYNRNGLINMEIEIEDFIYKNNNNSNNMDGFTTAYRDNSEVLQYDGNIS